MGRYLNSCSSSLNKTLRSYCKIRYLMSILRRHHQPTTKALLRLDVHRYPPHPLRCTRKPTIKNANLHHRDSGSISHHPFRGFDQGVTHVRVVRFYSSSSQDEFKAEAPVGILEEAQSSLHLSSLGGRLGQSFNQLSRHVNMYFKRKDVVPSAESASHVVITLDHLGRSQRRSQSQRATRERNMSENKTTTQTSTCKETQDTSETSTAVKERSGVQLFHISSLATRFGESYNYVASHINSVFSKPSTNVEMEENSDTSSIRGTNRRQRRRKMQNNYSINSNQVQSSADQVTKESTGVSSSWEEGYQLFGRHINKYFGAKVTDDHKLGRPLPVENNSIYKNYLNKQSTSQTQGAASQLKQEVIPETQSLFHTSTNTTNFGENYFQTASHINQYFKGETGLESEPDGVLTEADTTSATYGQERTVSIMNFLLHPTSAIPDFLNSYLKVNPLTQNSKAKSTVTSPGAILRKKFVLSQRQAEETTRGLIGCLGQASSPEALTACVEALNEHLIRYPSCKILLWQEKTALVLLRHRRANRGNQALQGAIRETLALVGYVDPVKGRGIRVLSIDGGGTRGVVPLQVLKLLEAETGKKIHQLFDYICGVSTGAVLAFMLGLAHFSLEECAEMYRRFGAEVFRQNRLVGTVKMGWSHSYYNTETWETILREKMGDRVLIKTARDELCPKVSAVSTVVNWGTSPKAFVFRNYNHTPGSLSRYAGGSAYEMWQAVRASSAAPGYFQEFTLHSDIHQDGGIILNNPCALAVHESRLLWPRQHFQCVLSLGTGRYDNAKRGPATSTSLRAKISNLICSATDTEGVHTLLDDLLAPNVYFRFNPMLSAEVSLDESRPGALDQLHRDTQTYLERNRPKLARLCLVLGAERSAVSKTKDWINERAWEMKQRWA
ncbi:calcium-independent phospholipase A2-gamma-like [Sphaeramia orbicularis]|uniref:Calcium-independent phospholipase A2-gamma-like n=1 Tax=Sphaeramia orbicularis TaxID=375764 RepID=A0A672YDY7_9TELE|nr:calcium-independent phospholipase A2-gamma-like [Sphaeramia orbicularis]